MQKINTLQWDQNSFPAIKRSQLDAQWTFSRFDQRSRKLSTRRIFLAGSQRQKQYFQKILKENKILKIITVGSKGYDQLKRQYKENIIEKISFKDSKNINYFDADKVGKIIIDRFEKKEFDFRWLKPRQP